MCGAVHGKTRPHRGTWVTHYARQFTHLVAALTGWRRRWQRVLHEQHRSTTRHRPGRTGNASPWPWQTQPRHVRQIHTYPRLADFRPVPPDVRAFLPRVFRCVPLRVCVRHLLCAAHTLWRSHARNRPFVCFTPVWCVCCVCVCVLLPLPAVCVCVCPRHHEGQVGAA